MSSISNTRKTTLVGSPNYGKENLWHKFKRRASEVIVRKIANTPFQFRIYPSYWHYRFSKSSKVSDEIKATHFLTLQPNFGAGIGHQLANWNSGFYFAKHFGLKYAHSPFSTKKWEDFLGFGENETAASELTGTHKIVRLPKFDSENPEQVKLIGNIINSYKSPNILFTLAIDQGYMRQCDTYKELSHKFFNAEARKQDKIIYDEDAFNVAIHIRRRMKIETTEVWKLRGLDNTYYASVLRTVLKHIKTQKKIKIYLFSQGVIEDFPEFKEFNDINFCIEMGPVDTVLHLIAADLLISSKSSFSYKPALISKKIQICPQTFWHAYPDEKNYILADNDGNFDYQKLDHAKID